jgi:hypothetical protein
LVGGKDLRERRAASVASVMSVKRAASVMSGARGQPLRIERAIMGRKDVKEELRY